MKLVIAFLLTVLAAGALLQAAAAFSKFDSTGIDIKKAEDKIAEALARIEQAKLSRSLPVNLTLNNSNSSNLTLPANFYSNQSGRQDVGSSSKGSFKGYYGMTASRHEIGKSGIDSRMFLSGNFELDKAVKFQDQGV
jgi:hypothetical protein